MQTPRHIGIDLHRNQFTCCMRLENGRKYLTDWKLEDLARFVKKLRPNDEVAVEVTGNTRLFHDAVAPHVARVVAVDPNQFKVISHSVKKTDPNDARNLALYLEKDLLPEVRMKDKTQAQLASLTQTRDTLVKLRTALKNKVNNILSAHGINLEKEALSSEKKLNEVLAMQFDAMVKLELEVIIEADPQPEPEHRQVGEDNRRRRQQAGRAQESDEHQGDRPVDGKHSAFGDRRHQRLRRRGQAGGVLRDRAAGVEFERNGALRPDHQTRQQAGAHGAGAVRSDRAALQPVSETVLRKDQSAAGDRQGDHRPAKSGARSQHGDRKAAIRRCGRIRRVVGYKLLATLDRKRGARVKS